MFQLFTFKRKKEKKELMNHLNEVGRQVYGDEYKRCLEIASTYNENVVKIFNDWWNGKCVSTKEYESQFPEQDLKHAGNIILETVSRGFG